jgi:hypothetical protein
MFTDAAAGNVARHYSDRRGQTLQERKRSDIFLLRELNNWVRCAGSRVRSPSDARMRRSRRCSSASSRLAARLCWCAQPRGAGVASRAR